MRIAFISFEYAGLASGGGIGTYVRNAAAMLAARGHDIEVFTAGESADLAGDDLAGDGQGVRVNRVHSNRARFSEDVVSSFTDRHRQAAFDVVEGPEYRADAAAVIQAFPELARVVRLHTPSFIIQQLDLQALTFARKARFIAGSLRRGRWPRPYWRYSAQADPEANHALEADEITAPSQAILDRLTTAWGLAPAATALVPNVFIPSPALLDIPPETHTDRILFLGRLEVRKGVVALARAIPLVLSVRPQARFRLVGRALPDPVTGEDLETLMRRLIGAHADAVEFVGPAPYADVPGHFSQSDICVFPSLWEASGYVCQEAMAAARGVVGSKAGGMAELLDGGRYGVLTPPDEPEALAEAILALLHDPQRRIALGASARGRVLDVYGPDAIAPLQEASYQRAVARARRRNGQP